MQLITIDEVAKMLQLTTRSVRHAWYSGLLPKPIRVGRRSIRWRLAEVEAFLTKQTGASRPRKKELA